MPNLTKRRRQLRELSQRTAANRRRAAQGLSAEEHLNENEHDEEGESEMEEGEGEGEGDEEDEEREEEEKEQQRKEDNKQQQSQSLQQREESEEVEHTRSRTRTRTHTTTHTAAHTHTRAHTTTHAHGEEESAGEESAAHSASSARSSAAHTRKRSYTRRQSEGKSEKMAHSDTQQRAPVYSHSTHSAPSTSISTTNTQNNGVSASAEVDERAWVQCNDCGKWRALPSTVDTEALPEIWTCAMNTHDPQRNNCDAPEENYSKDEEPEQNVALKAFLRLWMNKMYFAERAEKTAGTVTRARKRKQDVDWIQCSNPACGKWRAIAKGIDTTAMLKKLHKRRAMGEELRWFCTMNSWDDSQASCTAPQEPLWDCPWNLTAEHA